jgi:hypothetical protein
VWTLLSSVTLRKWPQVNKEFFLIPAGTKNPGHVTRSLSATSFPALDVAVASAVASAVAQEVSVAVLAS